MRPDSRTAWGTALKTLILGGLLAVQGLFAPCAFAADSNPGNDGASLSFRFRPTDIWPPQAITDLIGFGGGEGQALLQWTSPEQDTLPTPFFDSVSSYTVRIATVGIVDAPFLGDATAWFEAANPLVPPPVLPPHRRQTLLTSLEGGTTYYFGIRSTDKSGFTGSLDLQSLGAGTQVVIGIPGVKGVTNLTAVAGTNPGEVDLSWTQPAFIGTFGGVLYDVRVSTLGQIENPADFDAALPLSAFSPASAPGQSPPGATVGFTVTGLTPGVTHYFALRAADSNIPPYQGRWLRDLGENLNLFNFDFANFVFNRPDPVTNLSALRGTNPGEIDLTWTAPRNQNGVPLDHYLIKMSSQSVSDLGGDTTAWFDLPGSTTFIRGVFPPGLDEALTITGLAQELGTNFCFGIRSVDITGATSLIDARAGTVIDQACSFPGSAPPITDLTAAPFAPEAGRIELSWTVPDLTGLTPPLKYLFRVSTTANIPDIADFLAAEPLTAFTSSPLLSTVAATGSLESMSLTGLRPLSTYYFAIRIEDSSPGIPLVSEWERNPGLGLNPANFAIAPFIARDPNPITDLTALTGTGEGEISVSWTAPKNDYFVPISSYLVRIATFPVSALAGDATAWFNAASTAVVVAPAAGPGTLEQITLSGLERGLPHFLAIKAVDLFGQIAPIDLRADPAALDDQVLVRPRGVARVVDLFAATDGGSGSIDLTWTTPDRAGTLPPEVYEVRISSVADIPDDDSFEAAAPLSALTATPLPAVGAAGTAEALTVTGLEPFTTYYFAIRVVDSSGTPHAGVWTHDAALGLNTTNFALPSFQFGVPEAITGLTALTGDSAGRIDLAWAAPANPNFVPISSYTVRFATFSVGDLGASTAAWMAATEAGAVRVGIAGPPGAIETLTLTGLEVGVRYFFAVRSFDEIGIPSPLDANADPAVLDDQVRAVAYGIAPVTDLRAATGPLAGRVELSWTAPLRAGTDPGEAYAIRVSTAGNIADDAAFAAAAPLTAFSGSPVPAVGAGESAESMSVTGLTPFTTYYFAMRVSDSSSPAANIGAWLRDDLTRNATNFAAASFFGNLPEPVSDLAASQGGIEGEIDLEWTAPLNANLIPISSYEVRYASFAVAALAGNATAWWDSAAGNAVAVSTAGSPGSLESLTVPGLYPLTTFYFAVRSADALGENSFLDLGADPNGAAAQAFSLPRNDPPGVVTGLAGSRELLRADLRWDDLPGGIGGKGLDFLHYRVERSTDNGQFAAIATTTALSFTDIPLEAFATYYFRVVAKDKLGLESQASSAAAVVPFTIAPQTPFGARVARSSAAIEISWRPTDRFMDTRAFLNPSAPLADELLGYRILRSTLSDTGYAAAAQLGAGTTVYTEPEAGTAYFYRVEAFNNWFQSTGAVTLAPGGEQIYEFEDGLTRVIIDEDQAARLTKEVTGLEDDILLDRRLRLEDNGEKILQSIEIVPLVGGAKPAENFAFARPVAVVVHYLVDEDGSPVPQAGGLSAAEAKRPQVRPAFAAEAAPSAGTAHLGLFWHNGQEFKKLYGEVDTGAQTVAARTPNVGRFQVRTVLREAGVTFDLSNVTTRVITPNGDGRNDHILFLFDNPRGSAVQGKIYDLRGAFVAAMEPGPQPNSLQWGGTMNGRTVTSGVYVYQIEGEGRVFNGTVVVAR